VFIPRFFGFVGMVGNVSDDPKGFTGKSNLYGLADEAG